MTSDCCRIDGGAIYKISEVAEWRAAEAEGVYLGSADDVRDGFIHFSTAAQLEVTARKYFAGRPGLLLIAFDPATLGPELKWEPSRGGALFPHLHAPLPTGLASWIRPLPLDGDGVPRITETLAGAPDGKKA